MNQYRLAYLEIDQRQSVRKFRAYARGARGAKILIGNWATLYDIAPGDAVLSVTGLESVSSILVGSRK